MNCDNANSTNKVIYIKKDINPSIEVKKNCITVSGTNYGLIASADNLMYRFIKVIDPDVMG